MAHVPESFCKMLKSSASHHVEVETQRTTTSIIDTLILTVAQATQDSDFHERTPSQIEKILNRALNRSEERAWSKHRQEYLRNKKSLTIKQENERKRIEAIRKKELLTLGLLGHSNKKLCKKIKALEIAHTKKEQLADGSWREKRGKDSTRQLVRALALHTEEQLQQLILQIETFTPQQMAQASNAINTIADYYNGIRAVERNKFLITQLTDNDLRAELISVFEAGKRSNWDNFMHGFLSYKLDDLGNPETVKQIQKRIAELSLTNAFTADMRQKVVEYIDTYLAPKPIRTGGLRKHA